MKTVIFAICLLFATLITSNVQSQELPPVRACITNIIIFAGKGGSIIVQDGTNAVQQVEFAGYQLVSSGCYDSDDNVRLHFFLDHCPTNSGAVVDTVAWQCDSTANCPGGQQGSPTACGGGGSFDITCDAHEDEVSGFILSPGNGCCSLSWCKFSDIYCIPPAPAIPINTNNPAPVAE